MIPKIRKKLDSFCMCNFFGPLKVKKKEGNSGWVSLYLLKMVVQNYKKINMHLAK